MLALQVGIASLAYELPDAIREHARQAPSLGRCTTRLLEAATEDVETTVWCASIGRPGGAMSHITSGLPKHDMFYCDRATSGFRIAGVCSGWGARRPCHQSNATLAVASWRFCSCIVARRYWGLSWAMHIKDGE